MIAPTPDPGGTMTDPFQNFPLDDLLDLRAALTEVIDRHGKFPEDDEDRERVDRWQALAERIDEFSDMEADEWSPERPTETTDLKPIGDAIDEHVGEFDIEETP